MHICFNQNIKGYNVDISQQGNLEAHTSTLKSSTKIILLPRNSRIHNQSLTCIQFLVLWPLRYFSSQWTITESLFYTPNVLLIAFGNANDQNKFIPRPSLICYIVP